MLVIAHRGLPGKAPENSLAGIEAALGLGVDMVEIDVVERAGELIVAHSVDEAGPESPRLEEALDLFAVRAGPEVGIHLDVKPSGVEAGVVGELRRHTLEGRALVSSTSASVVRAVRGLEPTIATALGYPFDRAGVADRRLLPEAVLRGALAAMRLALPFRAVRKARAARADVLSLHHLVVSEETVCRCQGRGIAVFAWTVNERDVLDRVLALGVDGVVTDEPALLRA